MSQPVEIRIPVGWGELSALHWPAAGGTQVLFLHGWMDNAASFLGLAPLLPGTERLALEFAGHGHSDHRPAGNHYYLFDYLFDLDAALRSLGWEHCTIVAHSLGAVVASCIAAALPECVERLVLIDALGPHARPLSESIADLRQSMHSVRKQRQHRRVYASLDDAAAVRTVNTPMQPDSARLLVERGMREQAGEHHWRTDGRLLWHSPRWTTEAQCVQILEAIRCPVLAITTPALEAWLGEHFQPRLACLRHLQHVHLDGGHHLHMDDPERVAQHVRDFLQIPDSLPRG